MFVKNDESFICKNCGKKVDKLGYTSRDHCNFCLYSIHVDIEPGDRLNECRGKLRPVNVLMSSKKDMVIEYICETCGQSVRNIVADDDDKDEIYKVVKNFSMHGGK